MTTTITPSKEAVEKARHIIGQIGIDAMLNRPARLRELEPELALAFHWQRVGLGLLDVLNKAREEHDTCQCERCDETIRKAVSNGWACENCGFEGSPLAIACGCYDTACRGSGLNGAGCPHGCLTCPCCADGECDVDPWSIIRELRQAISAAKNHKGTDR